MIVYFKEQSKFYSRAKIGILRSIARFIFKKTILSFCIFYLHDLYLAVGNYRVVVQNFQSAERNPTAQATRRTSFLILNKSLSRNLIVYMANATNVVLSHQMAHASL